jgi:hypothetical protein
VAKAGRIILASVIAMSAWTPTICAVEDGAVPPTLSDTTKTRPSMQQLGPVGGPGKPPSSGDLVRARAELQRRFRDPLSHADTAAGARLAAETLLAAATTESDRALKWLMLDEARRLGEAAGQAGLVHQAITLASAVYDVDAIDMELRCLKQIPLRGLDSRRAATLATAAENIAIRAEADQRLDKAVSATLLAYRAWQRAGNKEAARQAAARHDSLTRAK